MGRLIDVDVLLNKLNELGWIDDTPLDEIVNEIPTAYDVEKIVAEIEKQSYEIRLEGGALIGSWHSVIDTNIAIAKIRKGGVE